MKGPESFSNQTSLESGNNMATKSDKVPEKAIDFLKLCGLRIQELKIASDEPYDPKKIVTKVYNPVAQSLGYKSYNDMPKDLKTGISMKAAQAKEEHKSGEMRDRMKRNLEQMRKDWVEQFDSDPAFKHAMTHPEDGAIPAH